MTSSDSDLMYRLLVQGVVDYAIYMLSPEGIVSNWNAGAQRAKGYVAAEIVGQHFSRFYPPEDISTGLPERNLATALNTGRCEDEGWRLRKDGSKFWAHVVIDAIRNEDGELLGFAKITRDCTEQREIQLAQREQERRFRILVQGVTDYAIYMLDLDGNVVNWNAGAERAKGYKADEIIGKHFSVFYTPDDREAGLPQRALDKALKDGRFEAEGWRLRKDGSRFWTNVVIDVIRDESGEVLGFAKITRDITESYQQKLNLIHAKELAEEFSQKMAALSGFLDSVIGNIPAAVIAQERLTGKMLLINEQARTLFAANRDEPRGYTLRECFEAPIAEYLERQAATPTADADVSANVTNVETVRGKRMLRSRSVQGESPDGKDSYTLIITEDVTDEVAAYAQIHHMAQHDGLTNLPNRTLFKERLTDALAQAERDKVHAALLCLDLDNFKNINDAFGHAFGDKILLMLAHRLKKSLRENDTLARLGGDEFAIVLPGVKRLEEARLAAQRMIDAVAHPFAIDGHEFKVGLSIGIALTDESQSTADQLLRFSDMALYEAKRNGRSRFELFRPEMEESAKVRHQVEMDLRKALHLGQLQMHYQPIIQKADCHISGYEALIRWNHPTRGLVGPVDFIPIAEETGLIHELGARALNLACQEAATWPNGEFVAVNLSPVQFKGSELVSTVALALADSGLHPSRLELEITESVLLDNTDGNIRTLRALKALGVTISLDDFGTGYSSLSYLRSFPFDRIKIDKSFVRDMGESREAMAIIRAITGLSSSLLIQITAEGVETEEQFQRLQAEGCSHFQGYFFGRPDVAQNRKQGQSLPQPDCDPEPLVRPPELRRAS